MSDKNSDSPPGNHQNLASRRAQLEHVGANVESMANSVVTTCGLGSTLDIGRGDRQLVLALIRRGVAARGFDISGNGEKASDQPLLNHLFSEGSLLPLPFADESFETIVARNGIELLPTEETLPALQEIYRVSRKFVFLQVSTAQGRSYWENLCFDAGFRKHPFYYKVNDYEALNEDGENIYVLLEKIPSSALARYPLESLAEERGLHMDMARDSGERSDAHMVRYQWASHYIKRGDRVLDAACGLGYGSHMIRHLTQASCVWGIDGSEYAVDYAQTAFPCHSQNGGYKQGFLPDALSEFPDSSFDAIVSFETLEHVENPKGLLKEFHRLLTPGGRIIVSVPNDWSDESGEDPNPFHLHVYDWARLKSELSAHFILEEAFAQTASQCKVAGKGGAWERRPRALKKAPLSETAPEDCEWWLMTGMKSPLCSTEAYQERVFENIISSNHPSVRYSEYFTHPWLMHSMVNAGYRLKDPLALEALIDEVLQSVPSRSNDYAAALCVKAYQIAAGPLDDPCEAQQTLKKIDAVLELQHQNPMELRWKVSLTFVKGKLLQTSGHLQEAKTAYINCTHYDIKSFGVHLATKITEAYYLGGKIAYSLGNIEEARTHWRNGIEYGKTLLSTSLADILICQDSPNLFNHGDGIREYTVAWDNIARCANGIHLLNLGGPVYYPALENCHQTEYSGVTADLISTRAALIERTNDLVETRQSLVERTHLLEQASKDLNERTQDLVQTRNTLIERTLTLERVSRELIERTEELVSTRQTLAERTLRLEKLSKKSRLL